MRTGPRPWRDARGDRDIVKICSGDDVRRCVWETWRRPTLPRLKTKYHWRGGFSRPSSEWDRVCTPRHGHQVTETHRRTYEAVCSRWLKTRNQAHRARRNFCVCENDAEQAVRAIRTGQLHALPRFHTRPINVVVFHGSRGRSYFEGSFPLRCFQRLSRPHLATRRCRWRDNRCTRGAFIPVLSY